MDRALAPRTDLDVDLAIIGAGTAGLLMADAAAAASRRLRLIVLEPRRITPNPRLWVFPAKPGHALERFVSSRLDRVSVEGRDRPLRDLRLDLVHARHVQDAALDRLAAARAGAVEQGVRIDRIEAESGGVWLNTSQGRIHASAVIDTRPGPLAAVANGCWTQISWFAQVPSADIAPGFSISGATVSDGTLFMEYALALPDGSALVEMTGLCRPGEDGAAVKQRLAERLVALGGDLDIQAFRRAVFPLDLNRPPRAKEARLVYAPAGSGGLRFGAGRAALRLARWAQSEASSFARTGRLASPLIMSRAEQQAARRLLRRLEAGPETAADWINTALRQADADAALRFLAAAPQGGRLWLRRSEGFEA